MANVIIDGGIDRWVKFIPEMDLLALFFSRILDCTKIHHHLALRMMLTILPFDPSPSPRHSDSTNAPRKLNLLRDNGTPRYLEKRASQSSKANLWSQLHEIHP